MYWSLVWGIHTTISARQPNSMVGCHGNSSAPFAINPLGPNICLQILQAYLLTFPWRTSWENLFKDHSIFSPRWSFYCFSQPFLLIMYGYCWEKIDVGHSWGIISFSLLPLHLHGNACYAAGRGQATLTSTKRESRVEDYTFLGNWPPTPPPPQANILPLVRSKCWCWLWVGVGW